MTDPVIRTMSLGFPWVTEDPFLFCVHHMDHYPAANEHMGPVASLEARDIGMDFSGADGWSMYHGSIVPGFPQHPHRGFETVTFMRQGTIDHSDSLGATARFGRRRRPVAHRRSGDRPLRDDAVAGPDGPEPVGVVPDLAEPSGGAEDGRPLLHDAVATDRSLRW